MLILTCVPFWIGSAVGTEALGRLIYEPGPLTVIGAYNSGIDGIVAFYFEVRSSGSEVEVASEKHPVCGSGSPSAS